MMQGANLLKKKVKNRSFKKIDKTDKLIERQIKEKNTCTQIANKRN